MEARICEKCQRVCGPHQPDACLGELPGVVGACCGHGNREKAFIGWGDNGPTIRGFWVDEEWRAEVHKWKHEENNKEVSITFQMVRDKLDDEWSDEDLISIGQFCVEIARDRAANFENYTRFR